jgi:ATP-dependent protease ClpP protease subunit
MIVHLIGEVNSKMLRKAIAALDEAKAADDVLVVRITSHGGDPDIALAIAGLLRSSPRATITEVYGQCYSAATLIFASCPIRRMQKWSFCMVHEASETVGGNASSIKHAAKHMERTEGHWNAIMAELTGTDAKVWEKLNEKDTYLNADECLRLSLATEII